jgi:prevent-host-death family protein
MIVDAYRRLFAVSITTISSREFNQDAGGAKRAAEKGPVIITDRGRPSHVLLSYEDYRRLTGAGQSLLEIVAQDEDDDIDFDPPLMGHGIFQHLDFD